MVKTPTNLDCAVLGINEGREGTLTALALVFSAHEFVLARYRLRVPAVCQGLLLLARDSRVDARLRLRDRDTVRALLLRAVACDALEALTLLVFGAQCGQKDELALAALLLLCAQLELSVFFEQDVVL